MVNGTPEMHGITRRIAEQDAALERAQRSTAEKKKAAAASNTKPARDALPTLKELIEQAKPDECELDELHAGRMLACILRPRFLYNTTAKKWYTYNAGIWSVDEHCTVQRYVKSVIESILAYIAKDSRLDDQRKGLAMKFWTRYLQKRNRDIVLDDAQKEIAMPRTDFDTSMNLLHFTNGTLELDTMTLREHRAADMLTKSTRTIYDRSATFPRWEQFLKEIMPDVETRKHLQKCFGYALTGNPVEERFFILYGATTRNGKSTMLESIAKAFGDFAITVNPDSFSSVNKNASGPKEDIARIAGARLLVTSEPKQGMILDVAGIKQITGGDKITARFLNQNSFEFRPSCSIFFNSNHLMRVMDNTLFTSDRIDLITFSRHFSREERDTSLKQQFTSEKAQSAIMNWVLTGLDLYRKEGLTPPQKVVDDTDQYARDSDKFTLFCNDCIEDTESENDFFTLAAAYERFKQWTKENGFGTESKTNFNQIMRTKFDVGAVWAEPYVGAGKQSIRNAVKGYRIM